MKYIDLMMSLSTDTGIGLRTIRSTVKEYKETGVVSSPIKKKYDLQLLKKLMISIRTRFAKKHQTHPTHVLGVFGFHCPI